MRGAAALVVLSGCRGILGIHGLADGQDAATPDGASPDTPGDTATDPDTPGLCSVGFEQLPGGSAHLYRLITQTSEYVSQRNKCMIMGFTAYVAIPDDQVELDALTALATNDFWVGIDDLMTEGTYVTEKGQQATFLPFAPGEPTGTPQQNCLIADQNTGELSDESCSNNNVAICECEP